VCAVFSVFVCAVCVFVCVQCVANRLAFYSNLCRVLIRLYYMSSSKNQSIPPRP